MPRMFTYFNQNTISAREIGLDADICTFVTRNVQAMIIQSYIAGLSERSGMYVYIYMNMHSKSQLWTFGVQ